MNPSAATPAVRRPSRSGTAASLSLAVLGTVLLLAGARNAAAESWSLARVLTAVRTHDPAFRAARANGEAGRAQADQAWAMISPHVTLSSGFTRADDPAMLFSQKLWQGRFGMSDFAIDALNRPSPQSALQWSLTWDQPLWNGGREVFAPALAGHGRRAATAMERAQVADRLLDAVGAWSDAVRATQDADAAERALTFMENLRVAVAERLRMGQVADVDTLRTAARWGEARVRALGARMRLQVTLDRLGRLAGATIDAAGLDDAGTLPAPPPAPGVRGELAAAREGAAAAAEQSRISGMALLPSLNSRFAVTQYRPATSDGAGWERRWMLAIGADLPLFDGAQRWNAYRAARAQAASAKAGAEALARDMAIGLAAARAEAAVTLEQRDAARAGRAAADEALRLADARYRAGLLPLTDLLAAEAEATAARGAETQAATAAVLAHYRLLHAMGELR